jgi:hypothetical protein
MVEILYEGEIIRLNENEGVFIIKMNKEDNRLNETFLKEFNHCLDLIEK